MEVNGSDKHSRIVLDGIIYSCKTFYDTSPQS
jgi:hypothetical protein